ncbi:hypothetical protein PR048_023527 [Dryococelus australis]|uniref:RNA-directed DNA polymerase n=1 Tax=Dryococelus australis TaxID=614101 RepID=A0ABQ9GUE9_9NEOP|nr:hypothetical protein PR048_023527 [Dryococelus australis]
MIASGNNLNTTWIRTRDLVLRYFHCSTRGAQIGREKTKALIKREFVWPDINHTSNKFVKECNECQLAKQPRNSTVGQYSVKICTHSWEKVFIDIYGLLSKFLVLPPLRDMKAGIIVKARVDKVLKIVRSPELITCVFNGIKHVNTSPYYPCPNLVDRINKNVKVALTFSSVPHSSTSFSQGKVFLGCELPLPLINLWGIPPLFLKATSGKELEEIWQKTCVNLEKAGRITPIRWVTWWFVDTMYKAIRHSIFLGPVTVLLGDLANYLLVTRKHISL